MKNLRQLWSDWLALRALLWRTVDSLVAGRWSGAEVWRQTYEYLNRSLLFLVVTLGFVGMIMVFQGCLQAQHLLSDTSLIGPGFLQLTIREFAPTIGGLMLATRVGAGIAAEIGSMTVTEQIDALRMNGADPVDYLVSPRVLAGILATVCGVIVGAVVMFGVGGATAHAAFAVPTNAFFRTDLTSRLDLICLVHKSLVYGALIPLVAARAGFAARGGSEGVGTATTRSVIECSLWILLFDLVIGGFYFVLQKALG